MNRLRQPPSKPSKASEVIPYDYARPFTVEFTGFAGQWATVWQADQGAFILDRITMRATAEIDVNICDSDVSNPIGSIAATTTHYRDLENNAPIQSVNPRMSRVILLDHIGVAATVKGYVYGWIVRK